MLSLAINPFNPNVIFAGSTDYGAFKTAMAAKRGHRSLSTRRSTDCWSILTTGTLFIRDPMAMQ